MEDSLLEQLGFRSCGCCHENEINRIQSEIDESNMDSWSDLEVELMLEADEYNDRAYWDDMIRYENV